MHDSVLPGGEGRGMTSNVPGLIARFYLGVIFAVAAYSKITGPRPFPEQLGAFLPRLAQDAAPWYHDFVTNVVLPNATIFGYAVVAGETFVAVTLLLGILTRVGAIVAIVLLLNYFLAKGLPIWSPASNDIADVMLAAIVAITGPGRLFGLDALLRRKVTTDS